MDIELLKGFIEEGLYILIPFIYFIGMFIRSLEKVNNKYIPCILLAISIVFCFFKTWLIVDSIIQGTIIAAISVFVNQNIKQFFDKKE